MKKIILSLPLLLLSQTSFADSSNSFNVKLGAHGGGFGFGPAIEYKLNKNLSVSAMYETISLNSIDVNASSTGFGLGVRYYLNQALSQGTYLNFSFLSGNAEASDSFSSVDVSATSFSVTYGKSWFWDQFNIDAGIGLRSVSIGEINASSSLDTSSIEDLDGAGPSINISIGYAF